MRGIFISPAGCALAVNFLLARYAIGGPGNGVEAFLRDILFAAQTDAKNIFFDSSERRFHVLQERRLAIQLANGYFAIQLVLEPANSSAAGSMRISSRAELPDNNSLRFASKTGQYSSGLGIIILFLLPTVLL
jgi:hypothetical protein